jgi:hypothetical protein
VFFDPPPGELLRRHFGAKPQMFGKIAYGVPGDIISHIGRTVAVNGHPVAQMKPFTRFGEPLTPGATGRVPAGCYFAATPHKDGFDSRYGEIGFVCGRQIIGTGSQSYEDACHELRVRGCGARRGARLSPDAVGSEGLWPGGTGISGDRAGSAFDDRSPTAQGRGEWRTRAHQ